MRFLRRALSRCRVSLTRRETEGRQARGFGVLASEAGFTLIELMVVIAIIGILTAFLIPRVLAALNDSQVNNAVNEVKIVQTGIEEYFDQNNDTLPVTSCSSGCWASLVSALEPYVALPPNDQQLQNLTSTATAYTWKFAGTGGNNTIVLTESPPTNTTQGTYTITVNVNGSQPNIIQGNW